MRAASAIDIALWDLFGQASASRSINASAASRTKRSASTTPAPATATSAPRGGQKTGNWGIEPATAGGPYEDLDAFLNRADELAHSLLEQGITAMKIWPFDFAAEATEGRSISACRAG